MSSLRAISICCVELATLRQCIEAAAEYEDHRTVGALSQETRQIEALLMRELETYRRAGGMNKWERKERARGH